MTTKVIHAATITLGGRSYILEFLDNYEVLLKRKNPPRSPFDRWDDPGDEFARTYRGANVISLARWVISEIETYLKTYKPPFIFYTVGFDFSRYRLYKRVAKKFRYCGYDLAHIPDTGGFYLYRRVSG